MSKAPISAFLAVYALVFIMSSIDSDIAATAARVHFNSDESKLLTEKLKDLHALIDLVDDKFSGAPGRDRHCVGLPASLFA